MAYNDYSRNPDGSYMFGAGPDAIRGAGPAAEAKAREIEMLRQLNPELASAAYQQPDMRTAELSPSEQAQAARNEQAGSGLGSLWSGAKKLASDFSEHSAEVRAREAARGNFSGIDAVDRQAFTDAQKRGLVSDTSTPREAAGGAPKGIVLGDQVIKAGPEEAEKGGRVAPDKVRLVQPQDQLTAPSSGGSKITTKEMLASRATQQNVIPEEDREALRTANESRGTAAQAGIDAQVSRAQETAKAWREENANLMREQQASQSRMAEARAQYSQMVGDVRRMNEQVQSEGIHDYWADKATGTKFLSAIAVGLGVLGAGLQRKQTNAPMQMLQQSMNDDLEKQKANLQNKRAGVAQAESLLGKYHDLLGDMNAAEAAARASMLDAAGRRVEQIMKDTESPMIQANGKMMLANIQKESAEEQAKLDGYTEHKAYKTVQMGGAVPTRPFAKNDGSFLDLPGGVSVKASSPEMATQWRQQIDGISEIKDASGELRRELAKGPGVQNTSKVKMLVNTIATSLGAAKLGSSRMTGQGELENVQHILDQGGSVTSDMLGRTRAALEAVEHTAGAAERRIYNSAPRYTRGVETPTGDIVRYRVQDAAPQTETHGQAIE